MTSLFLLAESAPPASAQIWLIAVWIAFFGGCIGSFLNVVVYRLPAGMSVVHPGSHCPKCNHAIRACDNVPVFGWLWLRGKCRDCKAPIAARYPLVEGAAALVFLVLALVGPLAVHSNLPLRQPELPPAEPLAGWATFALHALLLTTLLGAALIEWDGKPLPWKLFVPAATAGIFMPLFWPAVHPVPFLSGVAFSPWLAGLADSLAGLILGWLLGWLSGLACMQPGRVRADRAAQLGLVGLVLGWQAAAAIAVIVLLLGLLAVLVLRFLAAAKGRPVPWPGLLFVVTLVWILCWGPIVNLVPFRGESGRLPTSADRVDPPERSAVTAGIF